jgi:hypothetical protein
MPPLANPDTSTREADSSGKAAPKLSLVEKQNPAVRARRLMAEARAVAAEQVAALDAAVAQARELAAEIADGGDLYPAGLRDVCRRLSEDLTWKAKTIGHLAQDTSDRGRDRS